MVHLLDRLGWSALAIPGFRAFLLSIGIANAATISFAAGIGWVALETTGSPVAVGLALGVYTTPLLLLTAHAGAISDHYGAGRTLAFSLAGTGAGMVLLGLLSLPGLITFEAILALCFVTGSMAALGVPGSQSIVADLVPSAAMSSAVALNFVQLAVSRVVGGLVAGLALASLPDGSLFILAGTLSITGAVPIARLGTMPTERSGRRAAVSGVGEAVAYARTHITLGVLIALATAPGAIAWSYVPLLPVAARDVFEIGPDGLGALFAVSGAGALVGALAQAPLQSTLGHGRTLGAGLAAMSGGLVAFAASPDPAPAAVMLGTAAAGFSLYAASSIALIQSIAPARLRSRLVGLWALLYWGTLPIAGIAGGLAAELVGTRVTLAAAGLLTGVCAIAVLGARREILGLRVDAAGRPTGRGLPSDNPAIPGPGQP